MNYLENEKKERWLEVTQTPRRTTPEKTYKNARYEQKPYECPPSVFISNSRTSSHHSINRKKTKDKNFHRRLHLQKLPATKSNTEYPTKRSHNKKQTSNQDKKK